MKLFNKIMDLLMKNPKERTKQCITCKGFHKHTAKNPFRIGQCPECQEKILKDKEVDELDLQTLQI